MTLAIVILVASWMCPGFEVTHRPFLEAIGAQAPSPEVAVDMLVWAKHESGFGQKLKGDGGNSWGILQLWGHHELEHDEVGSVAAWLKVRAHAVERCGEERALAGLSSGHCDRGVTLATSRETTARWWLGAAMMSLR